MQGGLDWRPATALVVGAIGVGLPFALDMS
jgi:hypothetical protein